MAQFQDSSSQSSSANYDPNFWQEMQRLHRLTVYGRWLTVVGLWLIIAPISLWSLRSEIELWRDYFTWAALRYGLAYNSLAAVGMAFCIGMTVAVLLWQSRNILFGISERQEKRLEKQLVRIHQQGPSHPLWKWVCQR